MHEFSFGRFRSFFIFWCFLVWLQRFTPWVLHPTFQLKTSAKLLSPGCLVLSTVRRWVVFLQKFLFKFLIDTEKIAHQTQCFTQLMVHCIHLIIQFFHEINKLFRCQAFSLAFELDFFTSANWGTLFLKTNWVLRMHTEFIFWVFSLHLVVYLEPLLFKYSSQRQSRQGANLSLLTGTIQTRLV